MAMSGTTSMAPVLGGVVGLVIGSFLNVVVHRLPLMLQHEMRQAARELLQEQPGNEPAYNLAIPASHCPHCGQAIRPWHNLPILGYLLLRGRCASCRAAIGLRYPLVELACGLAFAWLAWHLGLVWPLAAAMALTAGLLVLALIDLDCRLLPDDIVQPLIWLGLLANLRGWFAPLPAAVIGAVAGYGALWLVARGFTLVTGRDGLGDGDLKLVAALGAWLGWQALPPLLLLASLAALVVTLGQRAARRAPETIPYGTYLAAAGWLLLALPA